MDAADVMDFEFLPSFASRCAGCADESGQSSSQCSCHVGAEGQERGSGCRGHRAPESGHRRSHPVRPVHLPAGGLCQGTFTWIRINTNACVTKASLYTEMNLPLLCFLFSNTNAFIISYFLPVFWLKITCLYHNTQSTLIFARP